MADEDVVVQAGGDGYLLARLEDHARRVARSGRPEFSHFLDPAQCDLARRAARKQDVAVRLWGGLEETERCVAGFFTDEEEIEGCWPIRWLRCRWNPRYAAPGHRDLLGALLGQGIERENLGDIVLMEGEAYCAVLPEIAEYLAVSLREAGRAALTCTVQDQAPALPEPSGVLRRDTVASTRLDAVLAAAWNLSRTDALEMIRQGKVRVNYLPQERPDARLTQGALVSVRGKGRFRLQEIGELTRKGRIGITLFHYQ